MTCSQDVFVGVGDRLDDETESKARLELTVVRDDSHSAALSEEDLVINRLVMVIDLVAPNGAYVGCCAPHTALESIITSAFVLPVVVECQWAAGRQSASPARSRPALHPRTP